MYVTNRNITLDRKNSSLSLLYVYILYVCIYMLYILRASVGFEHSFCRSSLI